MRIQKHTERTEYDLQCSIWQPVLATLTLDCKRVVFFFSKSVKKSVKRGERVLHARSARSSHAREKTVCPQSHSPFSDSFQTFCLTARAYNTDCFAVYFHIWDGFSFRDGEKDDLYQQTTRFTSNKFNKQYRVNSTRNKILSKSCARNKRL